MIKIRFTGNYDKYLRRLPFNARMELNNKSTEVAYAVRRRSTPYVPKKTGRLRGSFRRVNNFQTNNIIVEVEYRARNPKDGFIYSYIQEHKQYKHYTTPGTGSRYLRKGLSLSTWEIKRKYASAMRDAVKRG